MFYWVHNGHDDGDQISGPFTTPQMAGEAIGKLAVAAFNAEGHDAIGARTFTILQAKSQDVAERIVEEGY